MCVYQTLIRAGSMTDQYEVLAVMDMIYFYTVMANISSWPIYFSFT